MTAAGSVLERKLRGGGVARSPLPDADTVGQALARQIEERFRPLVGSVTSAMVLECKIIKVAEAVEGVSVPSMLGLVEVEHAGLPGLIVLDTDLSYHLIDLMMGGDPSVAPLPIVRSFTDIDRALCRLPLEALVTAFAGSLSDCLGKPVEKRMRISDQRQDITQTRFAPDYVDVLLFNISLDIGDAARSGMLQLLLPLATLDVIYGAMKEETALREEHPQDLWRTQMRAAAAAAPVSIDAVLHRTQLTIARIEALRPGDVLDIPNDAADRIRLAMSHPGGKTSLVATGSLGAYQGGKVVRLESDIDDRITAQIRQSL